MVSLARQLTSDLTFGVAVGGAVAISAAFVIGIHVFGKRGLSRDDPLVVKTRLAGALVGTMGGVALFHRLIDYKTIDSDFFKLLGLRSPGFFPAMLSSIGLTGTLFAGPIIQLCVQPSTIDESQEVPSFLLSFRTLIAAPVTEEIVYRACLIPLLINFCETEAQLIFIVPLFFGIAHTHHLYEKIFILKQDIKFSIFQTIIQLTYTTIFGAMSTFFYLRTAHLPAVIAMHSMCNYFGLPNFVRVWFEPNRLKRVVLVGFYVLGLVGFVFGCSLIKPLDYDNDVFY